MNNEEIFIQRSLFKTPFQRMNIDDQSRFPMPNNSELTMEYARLQQNVHFNSKETII